MHIQFNIYNDLIGKKNTFQLLKVNSIPFTPVHPEKKSFSTVEWKPYVAWSLTQATYLTQQTGNKGQCVLVRGNQKWWGTGWSQMLDNDGKRPIPVKSEVDVTVRQRGSNGGVLSDVSPQNNKK